MDEDHLVIGEKIRLIRKEKQVTLKDLARDVCSVGKMSNIENGKAYPTPEELEAFAQKLRVPVDKLKSHTFTSKVDFEEKYSGWLREADDIEDLFRLGFSGQAKERLKKFTRSVAGNEELCLINEFLWAWYYKVTNQDELCMEKLQSLQGKSALSHRDSLIQLRVKNMLCALYLKINDIEKANLVLKEVRDEVMKNNRFGSEFWKVRYNMSIMLTVQGDYELARLNAEALSKEKNLEYQATYILAILDFMNNDIPSAAERIYVAKKKFRELGYYSLLIKLKLIEYFVQRQFVSSGTSVLTRKDIQYLSKLTLEVEEEYCDLAVYFLNILMFLSLERDYDEEVKEIQEGLEGILNGNVDDNLKAQSCLYIARARKKLQKDEKGALRFIEQGLDLMLNKETGLYGTLLYEKVKLLKKHMDPLCKEAIDSFVKAEDYRTAMKFNFIYVLPAIVI